MFGFLARAGHLLGRLAVSLGYGGEGTGPAPPARVPLVCFETSPAIFALETEAFSLLWETSPFIGLIETHPSVLAFETDAFVRALETSPAVFAFETQPEACSTGTVPEAC